MPKLLLILLLLTPATLFPNDMGELVGGAYVSKTAGFHIPVPDGWYIGPTTKSGFPSLIFRISNDQVLNIIFTQDDEKVSVSSLAKSYLYQLKSLPSFKLLHEIAPLPLQQPVDACYFDFERDKADSPRYRQGVFFIQTHDRLIVAVSVTEASEDPAYMAKAHELMKGIVFEANRLPAPSTKAATSSAFSISEKIGQGLGFLLIALIGYKACQRLGSKKNANPPPLPPAPLK